MDVSPDVPDGLVGDPLRLRQVLVNLVGNAIKFTDTGEILVRVVHDIESGPGPRRRRARNRTLGTRVAAMLHFSVVDTGIGIPEDKQVAIFQAFTQADGSTTRRLRRDRTRAVDLVAARVVDGRPDSGGEHTGPRERVLLLD